MGMKHKTDRKTRGRTSISGKVGSRDMALGDKGPRGTKPNVPEVLRAEANRPVKAGVKHRGDRRDTSKAYTNNTRHPARGNDPRIDVKTRAR
ncbi:MAG TPA: hypothetical protein VLJ39_17965 [Tepidisphaeraceae bacterium]|nr:hypothetical protein [Tepidisphaeraceae bacterium]